MIDPGPSPPRSRAGIHRRRLHRRAGPLPPSTCPPQHPSHHRDPRRRFWRAVPDCPLAALSPHPEPAAPSGLHGGDLLRRPPRLDRPSPTCRESRLTGPTSNASSPRSPAAAADRLKFATTASTADHALAQARRTALQPHNLIGPRPLPVPRVAGAGTSSRLDAVHRPRSRTPARQARSATEQARPRGQLPHGHDLPVACATTFAPLARPSGPGRGLALLSALLWRRSRWFSSASSRSPKLRSARTNIAGADFTQQPPELESGASRHVYGAYPMLCAAAVLLPRFGCPTTSRYSSVRRTGRQLTRHIPGVQRWTMRVGGGWTHDAPHREGQELPN